MPIPPYYLIATDLDGTLLAPDHTVTAHTQQVLATLLHKCNGPDRADDTHPVAFVLASGRHIADVSVVLRLLNLHHAAPQAEAARGPQKKPIHLLFIVSSNGACAHRCIIDSAPGAPHPIQLEVVHKRDMPTPIVKRLLLILDELTAELNQGKGDGAVRRNAREEINLNLYQKDGWRCSLDWTDQLEYHQVSGFRYTLYDPLELIKTYEAETKGVAEPDADLERRTCLSEVSKLFFGCEDPSTIQQLRALIERQFATVGPNGEAVLPLSITSSSPYVMEITAANTTKVTGLEALLPYIPAPADTRLTLTENAIAFGDGENDVEMLRAVKKGFLMGNASEGVRALVFAAPAANTSPSVEVIESNVNDGVAKKLTELFLSE